MELNCKKPGRLDRLSPSRILSRAKDEIIQLKDEIALLNPHASIRLSWHGEVVPGVAAFTSTTSKWTSSDPTSVHWYDLNRFKRLIAAHLHRNGESGQATTLRDFVRQFRGLSGTGKQRVVLQECGMSGALLAELVRGDAIDDVKAAELLAAMKKHSKSVAAQHLGCIGRAAVESWFKDFDCEMESFQYRKSRGDYDGIPWVLEVAFAWCEAEGTRRLITGINWSPCLRSPFQEIGSGESLDSLLEEQRAGDDAPVVVLVHLIQPRIQFTDRGKATVALDWRQVGNPAPKIVELVRAVTKKWAKQRIQEERCTSAALRRRDALTRSAKSSEFKAAAYEVMEEAYLKASSGGTLPAHARQIMYAARGPILERTGQDQLDDKYFTQRLLPDYMEEYEKKDWNVAFDARGNFHEPHTGRIIPVGTIEVGNYVGQTKFDPDPVLPIQFGGNGYPTCGPAARYQGILFIEKEGFFPLLRRVELDERYDIAIMSTKGLPVTSGRLLVDELCGEYEIPLFVLHDFDKSGFSILGTLRRNTRRYAFKNAINIIDLGLRLEDVQEYSLVAEEVNLKGDPTNNLRINGALPEEIAFLKNKKRVELNAFSSGDFIKWIESKLNQHGLTKVVPDPEILNSAYRRALACQHVTVELDQIVKAAMKVADSAAIPEDLVARVRRRLQDNRAMPWDSAIAAEIEAERERSVPA